MLQTFNLPGKNISPDKQMSMMRTYLSQLKDEMESELYDIKWENLSKSLQEIINSLKSYSSDIDDKVNNINAKYVSTEYLQANYITAGQISSNYATIGSLNAVSAAIGSLEAIAITTNNFTSQKITSGMIDAGVISASKITTGQLKANMVDFSTTITSSIHTSGTIEVGYNQNESIHISGSRLYFWRGFDVVYLDYGRVYEILQMIL